MLKAIVQSPFLNLLSGIILFITSGFETWETIGEVSLKAHHGIFIFSIIQCFKSIPEILHGFEKVDQAKEEIKERKALK